MAKASRSSNFRAKMFVPFLLIALLVVAIACLWKREMVKNKVAIYNQQTIQTKEEKFPIDTENDGVYTNYKYGFRLEYPKDIFVHYEPTIVLSYGEFAKFNTDGYVNQYQLVVDATRDENAANLVNNYITKSVGATIDNGVKVENVRTDSYRGVVLYSKHLCTDCEPAYGNALHLVTNDGIVIKLHISSPAGEAPVFSDLYKKDRMTLLNSILGSLKFSL